METKENRNCDAMVDATNAVLPVLPNQPLVSILIPSYNQGLFIRDTIDSILEQDYRPLKIQVVDGASTDDTLKVLESYHDCEELSWVSEPDDGVVDAVNKGFKLIDGDICGIQSSDDVYLPSAISAAVDAMKADAELGLVYGDTIKVDADGNELLRKQIGPWSLENVLKLKTWIPQPSAFFRRPLLDVCGGWNPEVPYAADTDLWLRMWFRTKVKKVDQFWSMRRMHDAQRDTQGHRIIRDYCKMIDQSSEIAAASDSVQLAAEAGKHLIHVRYSDPHAGLANAYHLYRAGRLCPDLCDWSLIGWHATLPIRRRLSTVKQRMLGRPSETKLDT